METSEFFTEEIDYNELEILQIVGKGAFGEVSKARLRDKVVAVKLINSESERKAFLTELKQLSRVSHPNIVQLHGASTKPPVCLVMEYAEGGSLYNVLHGTKGEQAHYTTAHAMSWLLQCARGVEYLHNMKPKALIHRDLKPPNLLLILGGTVLKICDFGTACDVQTHMTNNKGSAAWMAPEVFEGCNYSEKCDVFSWGIIMWEVFTRRKPFDEIGGPAFRIMWAVHNGTRPPLIKNLPKSLELLMTRCWSANSVERPPMSEVVRIMSRMSEFFKGEDEPLQYLNGSGHSDMPLSNQASWSQASAIQTPGATIRDTVLNALGEPVPVLSSVLTQRIYAPPVVLEDDTRPRGGMSAPPSLAASKEDLNGRSPRSGTPVNPFKRHSTDLSILDEFDVMSQQNNTGQGKTHVRTGSGDYQQMSFNSGSSTPNTASPVPARRKSPISAPIKMMHHVNSYPGSLFSGSQGNPMVNGYQNVGLTGMPMGADLSGLSADMNAMKVVSLSLDHQLQPLAAAPNNEESMGIFTQHCQLAEEYLKVQTEIALLMQRKHELMKDFNTRDGKRDEMNSAKIASEYFELRAENEGLTQLHENLKKQVDQIRRGQQLPRIPS